MYFKKQNLLIKVLLFNCVFGYSQITIKNNAIADDLQSTNFDSIEKYILRNYQTEDYSLAFDIAVSMSKNTISNETQIRGVNLLAVLAKNFSKLVENKKISLDNEEVNGLLLRFEREKYFIEKPKTSRFIKTMNYLCKGEYTYLHSRLLNIWAYKLVLICIAIYVVIFLLSYSSKLNFKYNRQFKRFTIFSIAALLLVFILFKKTCQNNIEDYSFYSISI